MLDHSRYKDEAKLVLRAVIENLNRKAEEVFPHHAKARFASEEWREVIGQRSRWVEERLENLVTKLSGMAQTGVFAEADGSLTEFRGREYP